MKSFKTVTNDDGLYYSFALNLYLAFRYKRFPDGLFSSTLLELLQKVGIENKPANQAMEHFVKMHLKGRTVDWIGLQLQLAVLLRAMTLEVILKNPALRPYLNSNNDHSLELQAKVLSKLFNVKIKLYANGEESHTINESSDSAESLTFSMEHTEKKWNALVPDNTKGIKDLSKQYHAQLNKYRKNQERKKHLQQCKEIVECYGSFANHHHQACRELSEKQYCESHRLSERQYRLNILPHQNKLLNLTRFPTLPLGKKNPMRMPRNLSAYSVPFDPEEYLRMFLILFITTLLCTHCMFLPVLFPFMHCTNWMVHLLAIVLSLVASFSITEKFQSERGNGLLKEFSKKEIGSVTQPIEIEEDVSVLFHETLTFSHSQKQATLPSFSPQPMPQPSVETKTTRALSNS